MIFPHEHHTLNGHDILLRSATAEDAQMMIDYLRTVCRETRFLMKEPDEVSLTLEQEQAFIEQNNSSDSALFILAFIDGAYAGNCSFFCETSSRRTRHRAHMGIALYQKYTSQGLGRLMLERLLAEAKKCGIEQMELSVVEGNSRAIRLYEKMGFTEYGRLPNANRYDDGTYSDDLFMVKQLY